MAENKNENEISELLSKLREKTVAEASAEPSKKTEKKQKMTDDDVKKLLRKYFDDVEISGDSNEAEEENKEPINLFNLDTSDFISDSEAEPETAAEPEVEAEPEAEAEPETESEPEAELLCSFPRNHPRHGGQ